jgi:flagella basal body P-ring formation protein FlgA
VRSLIIISFVAIALWLAVPSLAQSTITLRTTANITPNSPVTLGQIAMLEGPEATALSNVVVAYPKPGASLKLDLTHVRSALSAPGVNVNWGRVALSGKSCELREDAAAAAPSSAPRENQHQPIDPDVETPRALIAHHLAGIFSAALPDMRIKLSPNGSSTDMAWFDQPTDSFSRYDLIEISAPRGSRTALRVEQFKGDRLIASRTVMVDVLIRRDVVVAASTIQRDQVITSEMVSPSEQWLSPTAPAVSDPSTIIGSTPRFRIDAGKVITSADVQSPTIVSRGETVWVDVATGSLLVKAKAKALGTARDGQLVQLQIEGSKKPITARMAGRGRAVMELAPSPDQDPAPSVPALSRSKP